MVCLTIYDDRYRSCAKPQILMDYHQFLVMMDDGHCRFLTPGLLPMRYREMTPEITNEID